MKKLLILEDDMVTQQLYRMLLADKGFYISFRSTVNEALISLMNTPFDLIISCLNIEERNCIQFLQLIHYWKSNTPIVLISGSESIIYNDRIKQITSNILIKPVQKDEFIKTILFHTEKTPVEKPI